ncbi:NUDIX domain-containing protein [Lysinibacillus louembei]|uniref:NUDIX domain-containing protein n=1 Tax=Lysinibacillus louembei TaxID=1470088 RepID=A0ABZ0RV10_9BACI|nr:NUDIX domain-containing protein [Lysinibacillus louembei]WPK11249.1 NUDIX domain-containing protein [Lysinibacillus louembei]
MRIRSAVIIEENDKILLIKRVKEGQTYFVFPGGQVEQGETLEQAAIREALEEVGVIVELEGLFFELSFNGQQVYYRAKIIGGKIGTGTGPEYSQPELYSGTFEPVWLAKNELTKHDVRPIELIEKLFER